MTFIAGIDLSWTGRHPSGICILRASYGGFELERLDDCVVPPPEMCALLSGLGPDVVAAIDGPLGWRERCTAERELASAFGRYRAAPYSAGQGFLTAHGLVAGPQLGGHLRSAGFGFVQGPAKLDQGRWALEVYPHASHVTGFGLLKERLTYKKGPLADRRAWLAIYRDCLEGFADRLSPGSWPSIAAALPVPGTLTGGRALKSLEDRMDAVTCALAGYLAWRDGIDQSELFGEPGEGYIVVPGLRDDGRFRRDNL